MEVMRLQKSPEGCDRTKKQVGKFRYLDQVRGLMVLKSLGQFNQHMPPWWGKDDILLKQVVRLGKLMYRMWCQIRSSPKGKKMPIKRLRKITEGHPKFHIP